MPELEVSRDAEATSTLLCVDDEPSILSALKRVFRPSGYRVLTASGGEEGLAILEKEEVDLIISDMRMPVMDGAKFLEQARMRWPIVGRILLTGYADIGSTVTAINQGEIYRYIAKPWEDDDLLLSVRQALERRALERERRRLLDLTARQNDQLKELNSSLESKVRGRTEALTKAISALVEANEKLKNGFLTSIRVFSSVQELRASALAGHSRRVAEHARTLAQRLALDDAAAQDVFFAGLLHDIGKIGLTDTVITKPLTALSREERAEVMKHPVKAQTALMALNQLQEAGLLIRSHHERFDGRGYPDGLSGMNIPYGARILTVVNDYDALQIGTVQNKTLAPGAALAFLVEGKGTRYDPQIVDAFVKMISEGDRNSRITAIPLQSTQLKPGMIVDKDLIAKDGVLLVAHGREIDEHLITQIRAFEKGEGATLTIYIKIGQGTAP